jgi:hypothetical protein
MTVCQQYGLHCSHGLFIGLLRMDRLHRERRTRGRRPPILSGVAASARDKRCALMEKDLSAADELVAWAIIPCRWPVEKTAAPERRSRHNFGEYAFLEDSRYASQMKNVSV